VYEGFDVIGADRLSVNIGMRGVGIGVGCLKSNLDGGEEEWW
jgi:hypothetical protein